MPFDSLQSAIERESAIRLELQALSDQYAAARERAETLERQEAQASQALNALVNSLKAEAEDERIREAWIRGVDLVASRQTVADLDAAGTEAQAEAEALRERMTELQQELTAASEIPASADDLRQMVQAVAETEAKRSQVAAKLQEAEAAIGDLDRELVALDEVDGAVSGQLAALALGELKGKRAESAAAEVERAQAESAAAGDTLRQRKRASIATAAGLRSRLNALDVQLDQQRQELASCKVRFLQARVDEEARAFDEQAHRLIEQHKALCGLAALLEALPDHPKRGRLCAGAPRIPLGIPVLHYPGAEPGPSSGQLRALRWSEQLLDLEAAKTEARRTLPEGLDI
jgi:chromosome segregation ATPase